MNESSPLISFIVPCAKYHANSVGKNIEPLIRFGSKIEVIIVHDWLGLNLAASNLITIETPSQSTRSFNRNKGAEVARAPWLIFMDADIQISLNQLHNLFYILSNGPQFFAATVQINTKTIDGHFQTLNRFLVHHKRLNTISLNSTSLMFPTLDGAFIIVSKEAFQKTDGFNKNIYWNEDVVFTHKLALQSGIIKALSEIEVSEVFESPSMVHFIYRYFLSGRGNSLFFKSYFQQSSSETILTQLRTNSLVTLANLRMSHNLAEKATILLLRFSQLLGIISCVLGSFPEFKMNQKPKAKVVLGDDGYVYTEDSWRKII